MKLRAKTSLFFGFFFFAIIFAVVVFVQYVVGDTIRKQTVNNFRIIAEQSEGTYFAFLQGLSSRAVDWTSDPTIQDYAVGIIDAPVGSPLRTRLAKEFGAYVVAKKMPYDKTILITDLLDKDGIIIASTAEDRIGKNEKDEERLFKGNEFSKTINANLGEVYFGSIVFDKDEGPTPILNATVRLFEIKKDGTQVPLPLVLMIHYANTQEIAHTLGANIIHWDSDTHANRTSRTALLESYKTSDVYLVNNERVMVTPSRFMQNVELHQKVDTLPVRECLEKGREINEEYDDSRGVRVLGASMCFKDDGITLIVEVQKDEVYAPLANLLRLIVAGGIVLLGLAIILAVLFARRPLANISAIVAIAKRVADGDLGARVTVRTKDEIGYLASMFNTMVTSVSEAQKQLEESRSEIEKKAVLLEKDIIVHEKQEKELEETKKATLNLLEESWSMGEKLKAESSRLQTILSSIGDALILIDGGYRIVLVNPQALEIFAMSHEELDGKDLREVMKLWKGNEELPPSAWPIEEMFLTKSIVTTTVEDEFFLATPRRAIHLPIALSVAPLGGNFSGAVIVIHDTTADHELSEAKSGFISVASHQLRTPLTSIRWYSEMLLSGDVGTLNDAQKDFMTEVHSGAERLYQTVDLLLGISRMESGKIKTEKQTIDLASFTADITRELASQVDEKGCALSLSIPPGDPIAVSLDPIMLRQVVLNLFSNAIRYTSQKDGIIEVAWRKSDDGSEVVYSVRDNGIGIPLSVRNRVFSKFFRAENARAQVPDGSGLGLALVKELVESWGGKVWFDTEEGKGTTFFFTVPLVVQ